MPQRSTNAHNIGDLLLREGLVTEAQLNAAQARQRETEKPLVRILIEAGYLEDRKRLNFFKHQFGAFVVALDADDIEPTVFSYIAPAIARHYHVVPAKCDGESLVVAMLDPSDLAVIDMLRESTGLKIKPVVAAADEIDEVLKVYPEEEKVAAPPVLPEQLDPALRIISFLFWPLMSAGLMVFLMLGTLYVRDIQDMVKNLMGGGTASRTVQMFNLFIYIFLSWGIWTMLMFEFAGLLFQDLRWKSVSRLQNEKSRTTARVLSVFLGWVGADRFYLGYRRLGLAKLLTLGLLGVWWVIDAYFLFKDRVPDAAGRRLA